MKRIAVPNIASEFAAVGLSFSDPSVEADVRKYPITIVARTKGVAIHPTWGATVHDFAGMAPPPERIPIDYRHGEEIGYAEAFSVEPDTGLVANGVIVTLPGDGDAEKVAQRGRAGVPYQASIKMADEYEFERVPSGRKATANGTEFTGPLVIFRRWAVRGIALCPYGSDAATSTQFSTGSAAGTHFAHEQENSAMDPAETTNTATTPTADERLAALEAGLTSLREMLEGMVENGSAMKPETVETTPTEYTGKDFLTEFGDRGGVWFAQGKSFDECRKEFAAELKTQLDAATARADAAEAELKTLREQATAFSKRGHQSRITAQPAATEFGADGKPNGQPAKTNPHLAHLPIGLQKFAASLKIPD